MITQSTLLRTCTEKSILKFGKYPDIPVFKLLETPAGKHYLMWVYYCCSMINFNESVLEALHIITEDRIEKPGTNPELYAKKQKSIQKQQLAKHGVGKAITIKRAIRKRKLKLSEQSRYQSKSVLRSKNQFT